MWVVIHKEKMSIFSGYKTRELAVRSAENLNTIKEKFYVEYVEVRGVKYLLCLIVVWLIITLYLCCKYSEKGRGQK